MKRLLVLENDATLSLRINQYIENYKTINPECEVVVLTNLNCVDNNTLITHIKECDRIVCETQFVDDSAYQLVGISKILSKMPSKDIVISNYNLQNNIESILEDSLLDSITHHNIFQLETIRTHTLLNFSSHLKKYREKISWEKEYKNEAINRVIGKVKILNCVAFCESAKNLPIGEIVDILDMSELDNEPQRGVWVQGNGEPIKLVNDLGIKEFEIVQISNSIDKEDEILYRITNTLSIKINDEQRSIIKNYIKEKNDYTSIANRICEYLDIEKRGNRSGIVQILSNNKELIS